MKKILQLFCLLLFIQVTVQAQNLNLTNISSTQLFENLAKSAPKMQTLQRVASNIQVTKTINETSPGTLDSLLTSNEKKSITNLIITGYIDARDFKVMRDSMPNLDSLDISATTITKYLGASGTITLYYLYPANEIPAYAFYTSSNSPGGIRNNILSSIILPASITSIGNTAFAFCNSLQSVSIPASVTHIGSVAFAGSSANINVDAANHTYSSIDGVLFNKAQTRLIQCPTSRSGDYSFPSTVDTIGAYAFFYCNNLSSLNIPSSVTTIENVAFASCSATLNVNASNPNYSSLNGVIFNKTQTRLVQVPTSVTGNYIIPSTVDTMNDISFYNCNLLTSVSIPSSIEYIGNQAFYNCTGLISVTVNSSPVLINAYADVFHGVNLDSCVLNVPFGTKTMYQSVPVWQSFKNIVENPNGFLLGSKSVLIYPNAGSKAKIKISSNSNWTVSSDQNWLTVSPQNGSGNDSIVFTADANTSSESRTATVTISSNGVQSQFVSVTQIGSPKVVNINAGGLQSALSSTDLSTILSLKITGTMDARDFKTIRDELLNLTLLDLSEVHIAAYSGTNGTYYNSNNYPANSIPDYAFYNNIFFSQNTRLYLIKLPSSIQSIGNFAFYYLTKLNNIVIPDSVTNIGDYSFGLCSSLSDIQLPSSLKTIGSSAFSNCTNLQNITLPDSLITLSDNVFSYCNHLDSCKIGKSVTTIGSSCFQNCVMLQNIEIPYSVSIIGSYAFENCTGLMNITADAENPVNLSQSSSVFYAVNKTNCILNVPFGAKNAYANANQWKDFKNILEDSLGFSLETDTVRVAYNDSSTIAVQIKSNHSWAVSTDQIWVNATPASGTGNGVIYVKVDSNTSTLVRTAHVIVSAPNATPKSIAIIQGASPKVININAGELSTALSADELNSITSLAIHGTIDARDFKTMRDYMPKLQYLDISNVTIAAYNGTDASTYYNYANTIPKFAFCGSYAVSSGKTSLISVDLPITATSIADYAFQGCTGLNHITLPNSITTIKNNAFYACSSLKEIVLPKGLTKIQYFTFAYCTGLKKVEIQDSVMSIDYSAFQGCSSIDSISIPNSVTTIGTSVFADCSNLVKVSLPQKLTMISGITFNNCKSLEMISIPDSVKTIGYNAFYSCNNLKKINFGRNLNFIDNSAFSNCTSLDSITIPNSVTSIGGNLFSGCTSLTKVILPDSLTSTNTGIFTGCTALKEITLPSSVQKIGYGTFYNCTSLKKVTLPTSIKSIDNAAFYQCTSLDSITLPNSVKVLGSNAFYGCSHLSVINLSDSLQTIDNATFSGCSALKHIQFPSSLTEINYNAFEYCTNLTKATFPDKVSSIGMYAFRNCDSLRTVTMSNSLKTIGMYAFYNCKSLKRVSMGSSPTKIGEHVFDNCTSLDSVSLSEKLQTIGRSAFYNCTSLKRINVPNSVTSIEPWAFQSCTNLSNVTLSNSIKYIDNGVFYGCSALKSVIIPNSVTSIYDNAFNGCASLSKVTFGNSVTTINSAVFKGCIHLSKISFPGTVSSIGASAFESCSGLKSITVNAIQPVDLSNSLSVFYGVDKDSCILRVPYQTFSLYSTAAQWRDFKNIVENPVGLTLDKDTIQLHVEAGSNDSIHVNSNTVWTVTSDQSWLKVDHASGSGNKTLTITADENSQYNIRKAVLTVMTDSVEPQHVVIFQDAAMKTVTATAGKLDSVLTPGEYTVLTKLTVKGTLDATDFKFMRDSIPNLNYLDISQTNIVAYTGSNGPGGNYTIAYAANSIPQGSFYISYGSTRTIALKNIILPNNLTSIGSAAFEYCYQLDSIQIPNTVTSIGDFAFSYCQSLKTLHLSASLTSIGHSFSDCRSLTDVTIPNQVKTIAYEAFANCTSLKDLTIGDAVTDIGGHAFQYCSSLTALYIPNSVQNIEYSAFQNCTSLKSLRIGNSVSDIGSSAFYDCNSLKELILPRSIKTIGDYAFSSCDSLTMLTIPENITSIGYYAFSCRGLKSIMTARAIPFNLISYGVFSAVNKTTCTLYVPTGSKALYQAAAQWKDFQNISEDYGFMLANDTIRIASGGSKEIDFPITDSITVISDKAWLQANVSLVNDTTKVLLSSDVNPSFSQRTANLQISFHDGLSQIFTVIQSGLPKTVTITSGGLQNSMTPEELKTVSNLIIKGTIDARDFRVMRDSMPQLSDIDMSEATITAYSGNDGTNPSIFTYPANETPTNAFYKTYSGIGKMTLVSVKLPTNLTSIGKSTFAYAKNLRSILIPDNVTVIYDNVFAYCNNLQKVEMNNKLTSIGVNAFLACGKLTELTLPNSLLTINSYAFESCSSLKKITMSTGLTTLSDHAFSACRSLTEIELPNSISSLGGDVFDGCTSLSHVNIPNSVSELKYGLFYSCSSLKEIIIPSSVTTIDPRVFGKCTSLTSIVIPATVISIQYGAFEYDTSLKSIYAYSVSPIDLSASYYATVFNSVDKANCILYVPSGSKSSYQTAVEWKDFQNIVEMTTVTPTINKSDISIYPNPVVKSFVVHGMDGTSCYISIYDIKGKLLINKQVLNDESINVSGLPKGMYFITITNNEKTIERKIIKI